MVLVRSASRSDASAIAPLLGQLGYPVDQGAFEHRFDRVATTGVDPAWVAVIEGSEPDVVGFAAGHLFRPFELDGPVAELTAIVVDEGRRGEGVGRALVTEFEEWAISAGCVRWSVATAFRRSDAHAFYERLGYQQLARKYQKDR